MIDCNGKGGKGFTGKATSELNLEDKKELKKGDIGERALVLVLTSWVLLHICPHHSLA